MEKILLIIIDLSATARFARRQEFLSESICCIALITSLENIPINIP